MGSAQSGAGEEERRQLRILLCIFCLPLSSLTLHKISGSPEKSGSVDSQHEGQGPGYFLHGVFRESSQLLNEP